MKFLTNVASRYRGNMIYYIQNFLSNRTFRVKSNGCLQHKTPSHTLYQITQTNSKTAPETQQHSHPVCTKIKYLGLIFDKKLTWRRPHIENLKKECTTRLNTMRILSYHKWGAHQTSLLLIYKYKSIIRSKLDFACTTYLNGKSSYLKTLMRVQYSALRIATGAFRTSPTISLLSETEEQPLHQRRLQITINYLSNLAKNPNISTHHIIFPQNRK